MPGPARICLCHAENCIQELCIDPDTRRTSPGRLLQRATYEEHQHRERQWLHDHEERTAIHRITSATLLNADMPDSTVHAHQGAHSYATSDGSRLNNPPASPSLQPAPQNLLGVTAPFVTMDVDLESQGLHATVSRQESVSSHDRSYETHDPKHPSSSEPSNEAERESHLDIHRELKGYANTFEREILEFEPQPLVFDPLPSTPEESAPSFEDLSRTPALRSRNAGLLQHRQRIAQYSLLVDSMGNCDNSSFTQTRQSFVLQLQLQLRMLETLVESSWLSEKIKLGLTTESESGAHAEFYDTAPHFRINLNQTPIVIILSLVTAFTLHLYHGLSRDGAAFLLQATQLVASAACLAAFAVVGRTSAVFDDWTRLWPTDIRTAFKTFHLDPDSVEYICCKHCCALYSTCPNPPICTNKETPDSAPCGTRLLSNRGPDGSQAPIRRFIYQPFKAWLGRFLSRPGIEDVLITKPTIRTSGVRLERDVWDGTAFATFEGPQQGTSYFEVSGDELRLVFSLFVDWFNPFGNRASSTSTSIGAIYMVCLNLPIHLRYRMENIYLVGIIPGPKEPSLHQINHFLAILVRELLTFWHPGVYFTRTAAKQFGRLVRCALIPLVCDMPGLRKTAGLAGHSATYLCSFCRSVKNDMDNLNYWTWPRRTLAEHVAQARLWRDAPSETFRKNLWSTNYVRWTELLRLPYWDITKFSVLDAMHNLFLGHFRRHCVDIWHMQAPKEHDLDQEDQSQKRKMYHTPDEQATAIEQATKALHDRKASNLKNCRRGYLVALARLNGVPLDANPTRRNTAEALLSWRNNHPNAPINSPAPFPYPVVDYANPIPLKKEPVLSEGVLREVWRDMEDTILPSWMGRAPKRFGAPGQGRLKADQWRTACTVHLPITLIRLWHHLPEDRREKALLRNFLALVTAVTWATRRTTSALHRTIVQNNLYEYLRTLVELFGADVLVTNHHVSLHLVECLELFGPTHGWWAFPFERYNGILQRLNSNFKIGELELTFFTTFCRAANFKALMASSSVVSALDEFRRLFIHYFGPARRGTFANDSMASEGNLFSDDTPVEDDRVTKSARISSIHYGALVDLLNRDSNPASPSFCSYDDAVPGAQQVQPDALHCSSITMRGVKFSTAKNSKGDSMILFKTSSRTERAGKITDIFVHTRSRPDGQVLEERFLVLQPHVQLSATEAQMRDPYRHYPLLGIRLYHDLFEDKVLVIRSSDVVTHFASCPLRGENGPKYRIVMSLARD